MITLRGKYSEAVVMLDEQDLPEETRKQVYSFLNNENFKGKICLMPDTHPGEGSVIGFTMPIGETVIPSVVGVDINCGMLFLRTNNWHSGDGADPRNSTLDDLVRGTIPFGKRVHQTPKLKTSEFPWKRLTAQVRQFTLQFNAKYQTSMSPALLNEDWFDQFIRRIQADKQRILSSVGTLGGGNHFLEFGKTESGEIGITIHTGSRSLGKSVCDYWQSIAAKPRYSMAREDWISHVKETFPKSEWNTQIKKYYDECRVTRRQQKGFEALDGENMYGYLVDMIFTQEYAAINRRKISELLQEVIGFEVLESIETPHNFVSFRDWMIRKGAVPSYLGEKLVIPLNMTDGVLICEGKSNEDWNFSAPHGAGRVGSRRAMKDKLETGELNHEILSSSVDGIYAAGVPVDEFQEAYKPAEMIIQAIEPTAQILKRFQPFIAMKDITDEDRMSKSKAAKHVQESAR